MFRCEKKSFDLKKFAMIMYAGHFGSFTFTYSRWIIASEAAPQEYRVVFFFLHPRLSFFAACSHYFCLFLSLRFFKNIRAMFPWPPHTEPTAFHPIHSFRQRPSPPAEWIFMYVLGQSFIMDNFICWQTSLKNGT